MPAYLLAFGIALADEDPKAECICESPTIPIIYAIAGPNLLVALNKVQRDFFSLSVGAVQEGVDGIYSG